MHTKLNLNYFRDIIFKSQRDTWGFPLFAVRLLAVSQLRHTREGIKIHYSFYVILK